MNQMNQAPLKSKHSDLESPSALSYLTNLQRRTTLTSAILASTLLISGCSQGPDDSFASSKEYASEETYETTDDVDISVPAMEQGANADSDKQLSVENLSDDSELSLENNAADIEVEGKQLLISASSDFEVEDVVKTRNEIENLTQQQGGYVADSSISNNQVDRKTFVQGDKDITLVTYTRYADMTVRIPKNKVSDFLRQVQKQVKFLNYQQFSAKDVTLDLYREKLAAQLNSDMASELGDQRLDSDNEKELGSNVNAIAATYAARQQKEFAELERLAIEDQVKFSTLKLSFSQPNGVYKQITPNIDSVLNSEQLSFSEQVKQSLIDGWQIIKSVVLGIIMLWWLWLLLIVGYGLYRIFKRNMVKYYQGKRGVNESSANE